MLSLEQVQRVCGAPAWVWRELDTGGLSVVLKTGQKYQYSPEEVKAGLGKAPAAAAPGAVTNTGKASARLATPAAAAQLDPVTMPAKPAAPKARKK
jgi:hypothetical protein